mmetsp:Transcript_15542/g.50997  ORF Transcript_15542/g.50997 Transcript_15542/m.50997 type:complete len:325 (+) Transcript_15542:764-1738(+)
MANTTGAGFRCDASLADFCRTGFGSAVPGSNSALSSPRCVSPRCGDAPVVTAPAGRFWLLAHDSSASVFVADVSAPNHPANHPDGVGVVVARFVAVAVAVFVGSVVGSVFASHARTAARAPHVHHVLVSGVVVCVGVSLSLVSSSSDSPPPPSSSSKSPPPPSVTKFSISPTTRTAFGPTAMVSPLVGASTPVGNTALATNVCVPSTQRTYRKTHRRPAGFTNTPAASSSSPSVASVLGVLAWHAMWKHFTDHARVELFDFLVLRARRTGGSGIGRSESALVDPTCASADVPSATHATSASLVRLAAEVASNTPCRTFLPTASA